MQLLVTITKTSLELNEHEKQAVKCFGGDMISDMQEFSSVAAANKGLLFSSAVNQVSSGISFWALLEPRAMKIIQTLFRWLTWNCEERVTLVKFFIWMESTFTSSVLKLPAASLWLWEVLQQTTTEKFTMGNKLCRVKFHINYSMRCSDKELYLNTF